MMGVAVRSARVFMLGEVLYRKSLKSILSGNDSPFQ